MWHQYESPTNLRSMQFADPNKFQSEVQSRPDYKRLKEMEGKEVEAELYRLADGQIRASHVRSLGGTPSLEGPSGGDAGELAVHIQIGQIASYIYTIAG